MNELEQFLDQIEDYALIGQWDAEAYDEAVHNFLHRVFGELFIKEVEYPTVPDIKGREL